jgi:hypothetical protein
MKTLIIALLFVTNLNSQKRIELVNDIKVRDFIYQCINSFDTINSLKHQSIHGIDMNLNKKGNLKSYKLTFSDKNIKLSKKEYQWLFKKLKVGNYKNFILNNHTKKEIHNLKLFKISLKFIPSIQ